MSEAKKTGLELLREPFPAHQISKLPKPTKAQTDEVKADFKKGMRCPICQGWHHPNVVHIDYVGHAALTDRLLDSDPAWQWEPLAMTDGLPRFDESGGLWIKLTVCGVSRLGYGHAARKDQMDAGSREKEVIGDALRNAAMRFGAALDLWHKGQLHNDEAEPELEKKKYPSPNTSALEHEGFEITPEVTAKTTRLANSLIDLCTLAVEGEDVDYKIWELMEPLADKHGETLYLWEVLKPHSSVRSKVKAVCVARNKPSNPTGLKKVVSREPA